ncbi:MAG: phosphotransferase [Candidatus Shapirobacteria bacterium]|nr:phosphotransferase [Candidatus Shapirobacteria bacterium]
MIKNFNDYKIVEMITGRLGNEIVKYQNKQGQTFFLKKGHGLAAKALEQEFLALKYLSDKKISIPKIIDFNYQNSIANLQMTSVQGIPSQKLKDILNKETILQKTAEALRKFHQINKDNADHLTTIEKDLNEIEEYISLDVINVEDFMKNNEGKSPTQVFKYLCRLKRNHYKDSMTHGDYCLPNLLLDGENFGFIDLGECGPGDKYKDLSSIEGSIKRNFGSEWIDVFYKYYDPLLKVDREKIIYYQLIDQFDYYLNIEKYNNLYRINNRV